MKPGAGGAAPDGPTGITFFVRSPVNVAFQLKFCDLFPGLFPGYGPAALSATLGQRHWCRQRG